MPTVNDIIAALRLEPHPVEGGYFRETYRCTAGDGRRSLSTAIYYLLTPTTVSEMHRLPTDEVFHYYLGDPVRMLQLGRHGEVHTFTLGIDVLGGHVPQLVVPGGTWQGSHLVDGGRFALLGATMAPGFDYADYETGRREPLTNAYPAAAEFIRRLTPRDG